MYPPPPTTTTLWICLHLSLPPTVSSGGQAYHAGDGHHGRSGVMRERRAAGDPYWSYSGELSFVLHASRALSGGRTEFKSKTAAKHKHCCFCKPFVSLLGCKDWSLFKCMQKIYFSQSTNQTLQFVFVSTLLGCATPSRRMDYQDAEPTTCISELRAALNKRLPLNVETCLIIRC